MPEMVTDHCRECIPRTRLRRDRLHGRAHEFLDRNSAGIKPAKSQLPQNVTLGEDSDDTLPPTTATAPTCRPTMTFTASATLESGLTTAGSSSQKRRMLITHLTESCSK